MLDPKPHTETKQLATYVKDMQEVHMTVTVCVGEEGQLVCIWCHKKFSIFLCYSIYLNWSQAFLNKVIVAMVTSKEDRESCQ